MKDLTIEEKAKAKAYDNLIERLKDFQFEYRFSAFSDTIERYFPELKESEDERIRKHLISFLGDIWHLGKNANFDKWGKSDCSNWIAWLEKQDGKINPYTGTSFKYNNHTWGMCARDNGVEILFDGELKAFLSLEKSFIYPVHPQPAIVPKSELEPIEEKVESKFKDGDWIVYRDGVWKVCNISLHNTYVLLKINNEVATRLIKEVDANAHLWTINDAMDGDVLSYVTDEGDLWIMIYWSLYKPYEGHVHYHAILVNDNFSDKGTCCICIDDLKPATKEQCDRLFKRMEENGYEWDTEKKELKKI